MIKALFFVWKQTFTAIFDTICRVTEGSAAVRTEGVERTIAEQAVEIVRVSIFVTGKIGTFPVGNISCVVLFHCSFSV